MADLASMLSQLPGGAPQLGGAPAAGGAAPPGGGGAPGPGMGGPPSPIMGGAKPNVGPATTPQGNAGNVVAGLSKVRNAVTMLEEALPMIPMGSPAHTELLSMATKMTKLLSGAGDGGGERGVDLMSLLQSARQASQSSPMAALSRMMSPQGQPPAMPGPEAGAGAPPMAG